MQRALSNLLRPRREQKGGGRGNLLFLLELGHPSAALGHWHPGAQAFGLRQEFTPLASLVFVFELGWTYTTTILGL